MKSSQKKGEKKKKKVWTPEYYIRAKLRQIFQWSPQYRQIKKESCVRPGIARCARCNGDFPDDRKMHVDHISPVVLPETGFVDWNTFVNRLFCPVSNLQRLCKTCHDVKCNEETALRTQHGTGRFSKASRLKQAASLAANEENSEMLRSQSAKALEVARITPRKYVPSEKAVPIFAENITTKEIREYPSALAASKELHVHHTNVIKVLNKEYGRKSLRGWAFRRKP